MTIDSNWCTVKISNDGIYALMCLHTNDSEEEHSLNAQLVFDFLSANGIVYGINTIAINSMLEHVMYEQYICVARGKAPTKGADGYFDYKKDTQDMKKKPLINEDGTADYKNSLSLAIISKGELLATYIPPEDGTEGIDVFGNTLPALGKGKELMPLRGRGIISEDRINYYAEYSGHIVMDKNSIYIDKLYRINGDLDIEHGNVIFDGDVEVCGDVRTGLSIETKGNIFIHGHVGGCKLTSGKSITIEKGVQGRDRCKIRAKEDVVCKFVERCFIYSEGNIYADSILSSTVTSENQVIVTSKFGNVIGSEVYGMKGIIIKEAGNTAGAPTLLRAGLPREYYTRAGELQKLIEETDTKVASFNHHLEQLSKAEDKKSQETKTQILRAKIVLTSNKKEYCEELASLNEKIKVDAENSFVKILGVIHEGVRIYIGAFPYLVSEDIKEVLYKVVNNTVVAVGMDEED